jgi:acetyl esterase/lipase
LPHESAHLKTEYSIRRVEGGYAGPVWVFVNTDEAFNIDTDRAVPCGSSARGGLGVAIGMRISDCQLAGIELTGLLLNAPNARQQRGRHRGQDLMGQGDHLELHVWSGGTKRV